jgi:uncharacterized membrane-anchored protein YhcB (DUF1043 family)
MRPWQLAAALGLVTAVVIGVLAWRNSAQRYDAGHMLERLPLDNSVKIWVDVDQLRSSGMLEMLAGSAAAEDPEYKSFAQQIGFDYRSNLDSFAAAIRAGNMYFAVHGKFDFKKLDDYAGKQQQGGCRDSVCSMPATQAGRYISFYPLAGEALALAVSGEPEGVRMIAPTGRTPTANPHAPVWISAPGSSFTGLSHLPDGAQAFLSPLAETRESAFSIGPDAGGKALQIELDAACASADSAKRLAEQLTSVTDLLRKMLQRQHLAPSASDLSNLLSKGNFQVHEAKVAGIWPLDRTLVEKLLAGR